jgi:hypothetical protein
MTFEEAFEKLEEVSGVIEDVRDYNFFYTLLSAVRDTYEK